MEEDGHSLEKRSAVACARANFSVGVGMQLKPSCSF